MMLALESCWHDGRNKSSVRSLDVHQQRLRPAGNFLSSSCHGQYFDFHSILLLVTSLTAMTFNLTVNKGQTNEQTDRHWQTDRQTQTDRPYHHIVPLHLSLLLCQLFTFHLQTTHHNKHKLRRKCFSLLVSCC